MRQICLGGVARYRIFRALPKARQHHFHLRDGRILRLVNDDKRIRQSPAAHKGKRGNFDITRRAAAVHIFLAEHHI